MSNRANEYPNKMLCPLVDDVIEDIDCIENQDVIGNLIIEESMPDRYRKKENWREICKHCKYFEVD